MTLFGLSSGKVNSDLRTDVVMMSPAEVTHLVGVDFELLKPILVAAVVLSSDWLPPLSNSAVKRGCSDLELVVLNATRTSGLWWPLVRSCSDFGVVFVSKTKLSRLSLIHHVLKTLLALTCSASLV